MFPGGQITHGWESLGHKMWCGVTSRPDGEACVVTWRSCIWIWWSWIWWDLKLSLESHLFVVVMKWESSMTKWWGYGLEVRSSPNLFSLLPEYFPVSLQWDAADWLPANKWVFFQTWSINTNLLNVILSLLTHLIAGCWFKLALKLSAANESLYQPGYFLLAAIAESLPTVLNPLTRILVCEVWEFNI